MGSSQVRTSMRILNKVNLIPSEQFHRFDYIYIYSTKQTKQTQSALSSSQCEFPGNLESLLRRSSNGISFFWSYYPSAPTSTFEDRRLTKVLEVSSPDTKPAVDDITWAVGRALWSSKRKFRTATGQQLCIGSMLSKERALTHKHDSWDFWITDPTL